MLAAASAFAWILVREWVPQALAEWIGGAGAGRVGFMISTVVVFIVIGALLEGLPALLIFGPILFPIARALHIDPVHYGIVIIAAMGIAFFLPPVGVGLTIAAGIAGEDIDEVARTYVPYLVALLVGLALVAAWPDLTLVLPRWFLGYAAERPALPCQCPAVCATVARSAMARVSDSESSSQPYRLPGQGRALPMVQQPQRLRHRAARARRRDAGPDRRAADGAADGRRRDFDALGVSPYNVSKHLRVLREAGLLEVEKEGRLRRYALPEAIKREAAAGRVLDLGCCSFQFDEDGAARRPRRPPHRARTAAAPEVAR